MAASSSSSDAATLLQCYDALQKAEKKLIRLRGNPKSKKDAQAQRNAAQDALAQISDSINNKEVLVLNTVAEAKAFTCLLKYFEEGKRVSLRKVEIPCQVGSDATRKMWRILELAGLISADPELMFKFP
ncbi:hypothetical protein ACJRO7_001818 [Eucalyptus globulus]|uniref:Uncharacterized protein n=1 Tax=Eucalyptus globulus TaxID=34317 RepID=A0ABD3LXU1_EUCGL